MNAQARKVSHLTPAAPFDFQLTTAIFASGDPQIRTCRKALFWQVLDLGGPLGLIRLRPSGSPEKPAVKLEIVSDHTLTSGMVRLACDGAARILSIGDDLAPFYRAAEEDPILADLVQQLRGLRAPATPTVFEALADSIIEQQISLAAARSVENRLIRSAGRQLALDGTIYYAYPTPAILAVTSDNSYRACGLTHRKGEYLRDISRHICDGDLDPEALRDYADTETVIQELVKYRGIGRWTAELTCLRGLHRPDAFPADDAGIRRFIAQYYRGGEKISSAGARAFAERWGPWKGFAAFYLEVADLLGLQPRAGTGPAAGIRSGIGAEVRETQRNG